MHDARNEGAIKIKHMASRGRKRNIRQQIIARSPHRPRSPLTHTATRARQPILKSRPVTEVLTRSPSHTSASHHQRKASHQPPNPRPSHTSPPRTPPNAVDGAGSAGRMPVRKSERP
jgi:hypothetical protein